MFDNLHTTAEEIRMLLMPFAFVLCIIGIGEMGWRAGSDPRAILGTVLKVVLIVCLLAGYPQMMKGGQDAFWDMRQQFTSAQDAKFVQLLKSRIENQPSDALTDIGKIIPAAIGYFFQGIGRFMLVLLRFFQEFSVAGLIAVSPLLIGFLFVSYTQSVGLNFGMTSLTVLLWHVAICLVDITIQLLSDLLFLPITSGGIVQTGANLILVNNWLMFPFIMAFASLVTVFFYLSVPFVAGAIMEGPERHDRRPPSRDPGHHAGRGRRSWHWYYSRGCRRHDGRINRCTSCGGWWAGCCGRSIRGGPPG